MLEVINDTYFMKFLRGLNVVYLEIIFKNCLLLYCVKHVLAARFTVWNYCFCYGILSGHLTEWF